MQCPQCGTLLNPAEFRTGVDGSPLCPFCGASVRGQADLLHPETAWNPQRNNTGEIPGLISIVCGGISLICMLLGCPTCGLTFFVAVPLALIGIVCGFWSRGSFRIAGLLMNFIAFIPSAAICGFFVVKFLNRESGEFFDRRSWSTSFSKTPFAAVQKYQPLYHETIPGSAFHFTWGNRRYIACSLQQFKGQPPTELRSRDFPGKITIQQQVHKQEDVQVLSYRSDELDKITPLPYDGEEQIADGEDVMLQIKNRTLSGTITGRDPRNPKHWLFQVSEVVTSADCIGAPVLNESADKVIGVAVASPGSGQTLTISFEPLNLPQRLR